MTQASGCILFDLDGTLVDSAPDLAASANYMRGQFGLAPLPYPAMRESAGQGARGMLWASLRTGPACTRFESLKEQYLAHYEAHISERSAPFEGVLEMLGAIAAAGLSWGIVTNKAGHLARKLCASQSLLPESGCVVSGTDMGLLKPRPEPVLEGMRLMGADPANAIYVGDDARDAGAAAAAGVPFIAARWGYVGGGADISRWGAALIAHRPSEIVPAALEILKSRRG